MADSTGREMNRDVEAHLPKVLVKVVAPMRAGVNVIHAGGYADWDGLHVTGHAFKADGRERAYKFTGPMIRRLQGNPQLDVRLDDEALAQLGGSGTGVKLASELDEKNATIKRLEAELSSRERDVSGMSAVPEDPAAQGDKSELLASPHKVVRVDEDPEVKTKKEAGKSGK